MAQSSEVVEVFFLSFYVNCLNIYQIVILKEDKCKNKLKTIKTENLKSLKRLCLCPISNYKLQVTSYKLQVTCKFWSYPHIQEYHR